MGEKNILGTQEKSEKPNLDATGTKLVSEPTALSSGFRLGLLFLRSFFALLSLPAGFLCLPVLHIPHNSYSNEFMCLSFELQHQSFVTISLFLYWKSFVRESYWSQLLVSSLIDWLLLGGISFWSGQLWLNMGNGV